MSSRATSHLLKGIEHQKLLNQSLPIMIKGLWVKNYEQANQPGKEVSV